MLVTGETKECKIIPGLKTSHKWSTWAIEKKQTNFYTFSPSSKKTLLCSCLLHSHVGTSSCKRVSNENNDQFGQVKGPHCSAHRKGLLSEFFHKS